MVVGKLVVISAGIGMSPPEENPWKKSPRTSNMVTVLGAQPTTGTKARHVASPNPAETMETFAG